MKGFKVYIPFLLLLVFLSTLKGCVLFTPNILVERWSKEKISMKTRPWVLNSLQIDTSGGTGDIRDVTEDLLEIFIRKHNETIPKDGPPVYLSVYIEEGNLFYGHRMTNALTIRILFYSSSSLDRSSSPLGMVVVTRESEKSITSSKELMKMLKKTFQEVP